MVIIRNENPKLTAEPTVVVPPDIHLLQTEPPGDPGRREDGRVVCNTQQDQAWAAKPMDPLPGSFRQGLWQNRCCNEPAHSKSRCLSIQPRHLSACTLLVRCHSLATFARSANEDQRERKQAVYFERQRQGVSLPKFQGGSFFCGSRHTSK